MMVEWLKKVMDLITTEKLSGVLEDTGTRGYKLGREAGFKDTEGEGEEPSTKEPDNDAINSIGVRTHALSEKTISEAKSNLTLEVDKLYQEMNAAMKAGMTEKESLFQIQDRLRGLFQESFPDWKLERLVRDQFIVATKEGRRSAWEDSGVLYRQWRMHSDSRTGEDSKRMNGQIVKISEPYVDPLTGEKYMVPQIRPNDRCYEIPLYELPEETVERGGLLYAKDTLPDFHQYPVDFDKGGVGSGIKGHTTAKKVTPKERKIIQAYQEGVKKLVADFQERKKSGKDLSSLRKEFKAKFEEHRTSSVKAFVEEHKNTRAAAKARKDKRSGKTVESQKPEEKPKEEAKSTSKEEEQKAKRKARREARKARKKEEPKKEEPKKEVVPGADRTITKEMKDKIMNDPEVQEFLKSTTGDIKKDLKKIKGFETLNKTLLDWQDCNYAKTDHLVSEVFGMSSASRRPETLDMESKEGLKASEEEKTAIKQYYALTQQFLEKKYPEGSVQVFRGVDGNTYDQFKGQGLKRGSKCDLGCFNANSWTLTEKVAKWYAGKKEKSVVVKADIPIERILMHPDILQKHNLHPGYNVNKEVVALGSEVSAKVHQMKDLTPYDQR